MVGPRDYKMTTIKRLSTLSGNQCAAPDCTHPLIARDNETIISKICHIVPASDDGPRADPSLGMGVEELRSFDNLILLCDECHSMIDNMDNEHIYTVGVLTGWKKQHESTRTFSILNERPTLISMIINAIADADEFEDDIPSIFDGAEAFKIEDKIKHNDIKRYRSLIDDYKIYNSKVSSLYRTLEEEGSFKKAKLLRRVKQIYSNVKGKYIQDGENPIVLIRENADDILDEVLSEMVKLAEHQASSFKEDIDFGASIILVDAFMRCKVLEEPLAS